MKVVRHATLLLLLSSIACSLQGGPAVSPSTNALPTESAPALSMATAAPGATASVVAVAAPLATQRIPEDDQVAYYPFEGDAADASGHHNDGTVYGPTWTLDRFGRLGSALSFDGVDDHVLVLDSDSLEFAADFSLALWVKPTDDPDGHTQFLLHKSPNSDLNGIRDAWWLGIERSAGNRMVFSTGPHFDHHSATRRGIPDDTWSCVVFTYDSSDKGWTFYLNGHVDGEGTYYRGQRGTSDPVTIGGWFEGTQAPSSMYSGSLDDISIYQRTLSPADAAAYCANDPLHWGQAVSGLVTPVPTLIRPTLIPVTVTSTAGPSDDCSNGWSRLTAGGQAILPSDGHANGLRTDPVPADNIIVVLHPGTVLHVLEGPVCSMGYALWKVEATVEGRAMTGWIIEGDGFEYDLEPYRP